MGHLENDAQGTGQNIVNYVEQILSSYLGDTIAVSVKVIEKDIHGAEDAVTLCRSQGSARGRKIGDRHRVGSENTAFFEIRTGTSIYFGKSDLIEESQAGRYRNTNPDWSSQYRCAIVVPIRKKNPEYPTTSRDEFVLLGFLCADAKKAGVFQDDMMEAYAIMLMAAADGLYTYLETVTQMRKRIGTHTGRLEK